MITAFFVFVIGACMGSFCSVLLYRTRHGGSIVAGRSQCTSCKHKLAPIDLIPVMSWIVSRGRCRYCHAPFSWQYLGLEVAFGAMFLGAYYRSCSFGDFCSSQDGLLAAFRLAVFLVFLALIFVYDARHGEIPDAFSITGTAVALIINIFINPSLWFWFLAAAVAGAGFFAIQFVISRGKWVGDGDILLGAMIGAMVGWPNVFTGLFAAYILGLVAVIVLMGLHKKRLSDTVPLGPFLALGTALVLFAPVSIFTNFWYAFAF